MGRTHCPWNSGSAIGFRFRGRLLLCAGFGLLAVLTAPGSPSGSGPGAAQSPPPNSLSGSAAADSVPSAFYPDWHAASRLPAPLFPPQSDWPALSRSDITDLQAEFVADPFLFYKDGTWFLFFEVESAGRGRIAVATSPDGQNFAYQRIVLDDGRHHSYPFVFSYVGQIYMLPESE